MKTFFRFFSLLLLSCALVQAANWYVRPNGGAYGAENGTDWTNAFDGFSDIAWASVAAGDTIWVAGGTYTQNCNPAKTGTSSSPIAVRRARSDATACTTAAGWSSGFDSTINQNNAGIEMFASMDYLIFSGRTTASGGGYGWKMSQTGNNFGCISFNTSGADNNTFEYFELQGPGPSAAYNDQGRGLDVTPNSGTGITGNTFSHMFIHDMETGIIAVNCDNNTFEYIILEDLNAQAPIHANGLITWGSNGGIVRYCIFRQGDSLGTAEGLFFEQSGGCSDWQVYGNLFANLDEFYEKSIQITAPVPNIKIFNNTFVNTTTGIYVSTGSCPGTSETRNNLAYDSGGFDTCGTMSNNLTASTSAVFLNFAGGDFRPSATIASGYPRNAGIALATNGFYNFDMNGIQRGVDGAWDIGAYEFSGGTADLPPAVTSATIPSAGNVVNLVFSEAVTTGSGGSGGFSLITPTGNISLSSPTGSGTTRTYPITGRLIGAGEAITLSYAQPGNGYEDSALQDMLSFSGTIVTNSSTVPTANPPSFAPVAGPYFGTQNVAMTSSTPGATIRYTTNGTDPTSSSTQYTAPIPTSSSTNYRAKAFASGILDSAVTAADYEIGTWATAGTAWKSFAVPQQTETFTWNFRASATTSTSDVVIGLSPVLPSVFTSLAPIIRFEPTGIIDARNGSVYAAVNTFNYVAGTTYEFVVTINVATRTYSATVAQISGTPVTIASNYAFRSEQATATQLSNVGINASAGVATISQMSFGTVTGTIPTLTSATVQANTLTLGFSVPVTYGLGGSGGWTMSSSGGAVTLTPTANPTAFTTSRTISVGETGTISYTQPGNGVEAVTGGGDLVTLTGFAFNNQSTSDLTAPTPNPMTFSTPPNATSTSAITMTASLATDTTGPVQYYFDEVSGNNGATDSVWQTSRTYTDTGLSPGRQYTYRVIARDSSPAQNQTVPSAAVDVITPIAGGGKVVPPTGTSGAAFVNP